MTTSTCEYEYNGTRHVYSSAIELYLDSLRCMHYENPKLFHRLSCMRLGRKRPYFAASPQALFPGNESLAYDSNKYVKLTENWYADTNLNNKTKEQILIAACVVCGKSYGIDLKVRFKGKQYFMPAEDIDLPDLGGLPGSE